VRRFFASIFLIGFFASGFVPAGILAPYGQFVEVQITHTHEDGSHSHNYGSGFASFISTYQASGDNKSSDGGNCHTHTLMVTTGPSVIIPQNILVDFTSMTEGLDPQTRDQNLPLERSLDSIFRPPIFV